MEKEKLSFKGIWLVLKAVFTGFNYHKVTKLGGSLVYYTVFSMAPLLVVIISLCGIFLGEEAARGQVYLQLEGFLGRDTALQLQELIFYILNSVVTILVITLIFSVIFKVLPDAIIKWKDVISGALVTAALFMIGKF